MVSSETVIAAGGVVATLSIAGATYYTVRKDIRHRTRIRHTNDIRDRVLEPWLNNLPHYDASGPRGPDGGTESLLEKLAGQGFQPYPEAISNALLEHFLEHHLTDDAPIDLETLLDDISDNVREIRSKKREYLNQILESEEMEHMLSQHEKPWANVDSQQLAIWLREVFVAEYTGGHAIGETLWMDPEIVENGLKVEERDGEYHYYPLSEKKRERHQVTVEPVIKTHKKVSEREVEKLLHQYKKHAEYDFGRSDYNEHIRQAGEAMSKLISKQYRELEQVLEYYVALPILPNDCYSDDGRARQLYQRFRYK